MSPWFKSSRTADVGFKRESFRFDSRSDISVYTPVEASTRFRQSSGMSSPMTSSDAIAQIEVLDAARSIGAEQLDDADTTYICAVLLGNEDRREQLVRRLVVGPHRLDCHVDG